MGIMLGKIIKGIFGSKNERELKQMAPLVDRINSLEPDFKVLSDEQLQSKTAEFKERLSNGEPLDDLLPEAFAVVREAAKRIIGQRHYDVQLMAALSLWEGKIVEQKTGEGKTLSATPALYLRALEGKGAHLVTVNDYLSNVGAGWMAQVYDALGMTTGVITHEKAQVYDTFKLLIAAVIALAILGILLSILGNIIIPGS